MLSVSVIDQVSCIHSKQPWFVLSAEQDFSVSPSFQPEISHYYRFDADKSAETAFAIPDGCVDIVFDCDESNPVARVCGTTLEATNPEFIHRHRYFGVRFETGIISDLFDIGAEDLVEHQFNLLDMAPKAQKMFEQVVDAKCFSDQVSVAESFFSSKGSRQFSALSAMVIRYICEQKGNIRLADLEELTGYTLRTIQRLFRDEIGMSPKAFCRIIRCQSAIYDINHKQQVVFSDLACDLGFSDQSHFLREFKRLVSETPLRYQNQVKSEAYLNRIRYY
ncbi:AraC family transcriptional regulator [Marinomonas balearica]|uniref:AraC-like DNA-binding protein n=1 Tax=Marinomonas balearica TaxID=491947 RepID=A0A4R6M9N9_9GAMM|nr:helix-turn-helix domain-containing protein [Marinomonas balearica]TDO98228.1 AraC-like DNA-binding protein [Marinomonas balearica]